MIPDHLGGLSPGDTRGFHPDVWQLLIDEERVRSMLDVGCGDGSAVRWFQEAGCSAWGVDGVAPPDTSADWFCLHDYTTSPLRFRPRDLVWSCEFVEHVEERFLPNFLASFESARLLLMTHAVPGQPGWHHVNCRTADYWMGALATRGFAYDAALTNACRQLSHDGYFATTGLAFRR